MPRCFIATNPPQISIRRIVLCCGCAVLSFLAIVWLGLLPRMQAAGNILPGHQVSTAAAKIQTRLVASYGKLPLSFEENDGQVTGPVKFILRGQGYALFLTGDEVVPEIPAGSRCVRNPKARVAGATEEVV